MYSFLSLSLSLSFSLCIDSFTFVPLYSCINTSLYDPCGNSPAHMDSCILYAKNGGPPCTTEIAHLKNANMGCVGA